VSVEQKTIGITAEMHNRYTMSSTPFAWQTDRVTWIASGQAYP